MNTKEMKNYILENKKKVIISLIALLVIASCIIATPYVLKSNGKAEEAENKKIEKKVEDKKTALEKAKKTGDKKEIEEAEKKLEEAKEESKETNKGTSSKPKTATSTSKTVASKPATSKPAPSSTSKPAPAKPATSKPTKQKVWVVDKPAWTETVQEPIYSSRVVAVIASNWDNSITKRFATREEAYQWEDIAGFYEETEQYISGYNTKTINHPEEGHHEYR